MHDFMVWFVIICCIVGFIWALRDDENDRDYVAAIIELVEKFSKECTYKPKRLAKRES